MKRIAVVSLVVVCVMSCQKAQETPSSTSSTASSTAPPPPAAGTVQYVAINPSVFVPSATIESWINAKPINQAAIDAHRWTIWQGMTANSGQTLNGTPLPVWETWYDTTAVFANANLPPTAHEAVKGARLADLTPINERRRFNRPVQIVKRGARRKTLTGAELSGVVLSFNRFTQEMRDHIWTNHYYDSDVLTALNNQFNTQKTPIADRQIKQFPDQSIALKPVFWLAASDATTVMPYWNGTGGGATTNPTNPTPDTWQQCVLLDPTGKATNQNPISCNGKQIAGGQYKVVPISADPSKSGLYAFTLTQSEAAELNTLLGPDLGLLYGLKKLKAGDFAIFVAMHCATREITDWTWQTFWYEPDLSKLPQQPPMVQAAPASISAPWNNYVSCTAYYMVTPPNDPNGQQHLCYNPYLETALTGLDNKDQSVTTGVGVQTNCMTCHRAAVWNPSNSEPPYAIDFYLDPANPKWFDGVTKTEFSWATQSNAHQAPFFPPPGK